MLLRQPDEPDRPLPPGTTVGKVAEQNDGHLLILGRPGSGKTTLLLRYARELLNRAEHDQKVRPPVVLPLSAWPDREPTPSLRDWAVGELAHRYQVSRSQARYWVDRDALTLLLDGLDEVVAKRRRACVGAISAFRSEHGSTPMVVCSRTREDETDELNIQLRVAAVVIQPLTPAQVAERLEAAGHHLAGLRAALRDDQQLWEVLNTPLMLNIAALVYKDRPPGAIRRGGTLKQRRAALFEEYVKVMVERSPAPLAPASGQPHTYTLEETLRWLEWLARAEGAFIWARRRPSVSWRSVENWMPPSWRPSRMVQWGALGFRLITLCLRGFSPGCLPRHGEDKPSGCGRGWSPG
jgi:DNA polymerase III delta prime subunit